MQKYFIIIAFSLISLISVSQVLLNENFSSGGWPPWGWSIEKEGYWKKSTTNYSGGSIPEARCTVIKGNEEYKLISKEINLTGYNSVSLVFKHFIDNTDDSYTLKVSTQSGRGTWHEVWSYLVDRDSVTGQVSINITNEDVGKHDFRFAFHVENISEGTIDYWFIDNISLVNAPVNDCSLESILTPDFISNPSPVTGIIKNNGSQKVTSFEIQWNLDGIINKSVFQNLSIVKNEEYHFVCNDLIEQSIGKYNLIVSIKKVNGQADEIEDNNTLVQDLFIVVRTNNRTPAFECFESSTSPQCAQLNPQLNPWLEDHSQEIVYIKYPVNWPSPGDPYFYHDYGVRVNYYSVTYLPTISINGLSAVRTMPEIKKSFFEADTLISVFDIASTFLVDGTNISIDTRILPYADFDALKVSAIVFEKTTKKNIGTNGETEFKHVVMKMINGPDGVMNKFNDRNTVLLLNNTDLNNTYVENYNDLGVVIFIQDYYTKEILQSEYSLFNGSFNDDATLSDLRVNEVSIDDFDPNIFDYEYILFQNTYLLPEVSGTTTDSNAIMIISQTEDVFNTISIEVWAEDLITKNVYKVSFVIATDVLDQNNTSINIYPNPSTGQFNISSNFELQSLIVYDQTGNIVLEKKNSCSSFDLSGLSNGIYYARILSSKENLVKRIVLTN